MMMLSVVDVISIPVVGIATGFFGTQGYVYCSAPTLMYYLGCIIALTWIFHSCIALLLAINRCLSVHHANLTARLFDGNKPYYWAIPAFLYGMYFAIYTRVPFFTGIGFSWFFDPHFGYLKTLDTRYYSYQHAYHNMTICFGTIFVYTMFFIVMCRNWNRTGRQQTDTQKSVFLQVFLISLCTCGATATYVVMNFEFAPAILTVVSSFTYFGIHGVPPLIYLLLNDTIRKRIHRIIRKGDSKTTAVPPTV
uniref:G protein-coupled receptor n=1 Tax=Panagrellus redivivus TaxID=6233 RepID=A0A7E4W959_PANRE